MLKYCTSVLVFRECGSIIGLPDSPINNLISGTYTHNQKSIVCDTLGSFYGARRLIAYVGGLDLTGGRYDTPKHELFSTLLYEHQNDFRNANAKFLEAEQGPREPWHDIHSKVEGPIAYDIFQNFNERWNLQGKTYGEFLSDEQCKYYQESTVSTPLAIDQVQLWNCQLFRSITSDSAVFDENQVSYCVRILVSSVYSMIKHPI